MLLFSSIMTEHLNLPESQFPHLSPWDNNISLPEILEGLREIMNLEGPLCMFIICRHRSYSLDNELLLGVMGAGTITRLTLYTQCLTCSRHSELSFSSDKCWDHYFIAVLKELRVLSEVKFKPRCIFLLHLFYVRRGYVSKDVRFSQTLKVIICCHLKQG